MKKLIYTTTALFILFAAVSCKKYLKEEIYTEYDPAEFLSTEDGIQKVLVGAYGQLQVTAGFHRDMVYLMGELTADEMIMNGGGLESQAKPFMDFNWDPSLTFFKNAWLKMYTTIRNANTLLDNIDAVTSIPEDRKRKYKSEARFIRAAAYVWLYNLFGAVPLITTAKEIDLQPSRAQEQELVNFMYTELTEAAQGLPVDQASTGMATKGTALATLCKLYLNTKQWQKAADVAKQIIDLRKYVLFGDYDNLFAVANENNQEYIYVNPCITIGGRSNVYMPHAFPPNYPIQSNWLNYGAQFRMMTAFVKSFDASDKRKLNIILTYRNLAGQNVQLLESAAGAPLDNARSFKFKPDPNAQGEHNGNDVPVIRYADILLSRAEALNEVSGPAQESIDLINQIRQRAGVYTIKLSDFPSKDALRDWIFKERGWEFHIEGLRREDLLRYGKFISGAVARGKQATSKHLLFPIPQSEIDANPNLKQNPGY